MKRHDAYTKEERREIAANLHDCDAPVCPRCHSPLDEWAVPPRRDVSYVRNRVWLVCGPCSRSVVLDRYDAEG